MFFLLWLFLSFLSFSPQTDPGHPAESDRGHDFTQSVFLQDTLAVDRDGNGLFDAGDTIGYLAAITNEGKQTAAQIAFVLDSFDQSDLVPGSVTASRGTIVSGFEGVLVRVNQVQPGEQIRISFDAVLRNDAAGHSAVQAVVNVLLNESYPSDDPDTGAALDPTITPIGPRGPAWSVFLRDSLGTDHNGNGLFDPGDTIHFEASITNNGDELEGQVRFLLADFDQASLVAGSVRVSRGDILSDVQAVRVRVLDFLPGETIAIQCDARIDFGAAGINRVQGLIEIRDGTRFLTDDPDTMELGDPTQTPIAESGGALFLDAHLTDLLEDRDGNGTPSIGDGLTLLAEITNLGAQPVTGAIYRLPISTHLVPLLASLTGDGAAITFTPTYLEAALNAIPPAGTARIAFDSEIVAAGRFQHQGAISAAGEVVLTDDPDTPLEDDPTVTEALAGVPTMNEAALGLFAVGLLAAGLAYRRKRRPQS